LKIPLKKSIADRGIKLNRTTFDEDTIILPQIVPEEYKRSITCYYEEEKNVIQLPKYHEAIGSPVPSMPYEYTDLICSQYEKKHWAVPLLHIYSGENCMLKFMVAIIGSKFISETISEILNQMKVNIELAIEDNEKGGISKYKAECKKGNTIIAVIVDLSSSQINGYNVANKIRQYEEKHKKMRSKIYGITTEKTPGKMKNCQQSGIDDLIAMPLSTDRIVGLILGRIEQIHHINAIKNMSIST